MQDTEPSEESTRTGDAEHRAPEDDHYLVIGLALTMAMSILMVSHFPGRSERPRIHTTLSSVDPNVAPWWELTVLPRIGPAIAGRIVDYRESIMQRSGNDHAGRVFRVPADLTQVHGIGPKTVRRIGPFLHFGDAER